MSGLQCDKRLWLEVHRRDVAEVSLEREHIFRMGHRFGDKARELIGKGELIGHELDIGMALEETPAALARASEQRTTVYEAAFAYNDVVARTDGFSRYEDGWQMTEVKAATSGKDHFFQDCAVQAWVAEGAGYPVRKVTLAHIDKRFVYQGGEDYTGLLLLVDATSHVAHLKVLVIGIVDRLRIMLAQPEPDILTGDHCSNPNDCPFLAYCRGQEPPGAEYPVEVFGRLTARRLRRDGYFDARQVVDRQLTHARERRILQATCNQAAYFGHAAQQFLAFLPYPRYFLDVQTVSSSVPQWPGTRSYQDIPFQWSCHIEVEPGVFAHCAFLDVSSDLPAERWVRKLVEALGSQGSVVVYSRILRRQLEDLVERVPAFRQELLAIVARLLDLQSIVRSSYYHPAMKGSYAIERVASTVCAALDSACLDEIADPSAAQRGWWEASNMATESTRRDKLVAGMLQYCWYKTLSMVALFRAIELGRVVNLEDIENRSATKDHRDCCVDTDRHV